MELQKANNLRIKNRRVYFPLRGKYTLLFAFATNYSFLVAFSRYSLFGVFPPSRQEISRVLKSQDAVTGDPYNLWGLESIGADGGVCYGC